MNMHFAVDTIELKKRMVERGVEKICDLSASSGVSRPTLRTILSGKTQPSTEVINRLAVTLQLSPSEVGTIFFNNNLHKGEV